MQIELEQGNVQQYLVESAVIDFRHPIVQKKIEKIKAQGHTQFERAEIAFCFVRDSIQHSFDKESTIVTITASDALLHQEGICFAKAHLLATLLRGMDIPTGFCYQRVTKKGTVESGYALHGLNALYLEEVGHWFRVDPRGNKAGIHSEFSVRPEKLAYLIRTKLDEVDYPTVYSEPLEEVLLAMQKATNCQELFQKRPDRILSK
ncbi:transglutaminase family protein [Sporosarcina sp. FSL K6-2383]|uniref:transglutaminase-like domain-containing protein n=1 Tax=Sporosarcina sp. FSL K6-2383 TaxID=2921556 RepID=UPI00315A02B8